MLRGKISTNSTDLFNALTPFLKQEISLASLELLVIDLPQFAAFHSALGTRKSRLALLVKWTDKSGHCGYGECACRPDPFFFSEFIEAAELAIEHFLFPAIKHCKNYGQVLEQMKKIRGWNFAKTAVEAA